MTLEPSHFAYIFVIGDCGIHAARGESSADGFLRASEPREWIETVCVQYESLQACRTALEARCNCSKADALLNEITTAWSHELLLPYMQGEGSDEGRLFFDKLRELNPALLEETEQLVEQRHTMTLQFETCKGEVFVAFRQLFKPQWEELLVKPLSNTLEQFRPFCQEASFYETSTAERKVVGTQDNLPDDAPLRKYECLLDARKCFDSLRWSFIVTSDPHSTVFTFLNLLIEQVRIASETDPAVVAASTPLCNALRACTECILPETVPPDFSARAWNAWRCCVSITSDYWLSPEEVLLFCILDDVPVAIFKCSAGRLDLINCFSPPESKPTMMKMNISDTGRVRGHFERLCSIVFARENGLLLQSFPKDCSEGDLQEEVSTVSGFCPSMVISTIIL